MSNLSLAQNPAVVTNQFAWSAVALQRLREIIPAELRSLAQWVVWRKEWRNGKATKVPYCPHTGQKAESDNPATWSTFDQAAETCARGRYDGVGFVFTRHDPYCGVDFDHCVDDAGNLLPAVAARAGLLDSYSEWSQSGTGVHVIVRAELPSGKGRKSAEHGIEVYDRGRYFCMTGNPLPSTQRAIHYRQAELDQLLAEVFPPRVTPARPLKEPPRTTSITAPTRATPPMLPDGAILERACASPAAWHLHFNGMGRGSASELDWRLVCFYFEAGATFDQADRIFRRSALMRGKWDEVHGMMTYGQMTLAKAQGHVSAQRSAQGGA